jgi:microcystin-dependent protein
MPVYSSADLGTVNVHTHPVVADGNARWPQVFFDDTDPDPDNPAVHGRQFYDVKVTDASGALIYHDRSVPIIGTVSGEGGGGGGVPVDQTALAQTGDMKMKFCVFGPSAPADIGWVRCNGLTISAGPSHSGVGTERADDDTHDLFMLLYAHGDLICPVVGRTGNALTDFNAGKAIKLPDMRGRAPFGLDMMGNASGGIGIGANLIAPAYIDTASPATRDTVGAVGGDDEIAITTAQMPAHSHDATGVPLWAGPTPPATPAKLPLKAPNHNHPIRVSTTSSGDPDGGSGGVMTHEEGSSNTPAWVGPPGTGTADNAHQIGSSGDIAITGSTSLTGGTGLVPAGNASAHENMPPFMLIQFQIKL